jgi:putative oxidoreductase
MSPLQDALALLARVLMSWFFIVEGALKIQTYSGVLDYMAGFGVPGSLLPFVIALELAGGLAVLLGLFTRWAALALAVFCALTAVLFHGNISDGNEFIHFGKNLTMAGGFLALAASGPGRWSLDARRAAA